MGIIPPLPLHVYRPDAPRSFDEKGKGRLPDGTYPQRVAKYEAPQGAAMRLDCPPTCRSSLRDPSVPLWITESQKKADALASHGFCALALLGVWNWRGRNGLGGLTALADQWTGLYTLLWRQPPEAQTFVQHGKRGPAVSWLSRQLALFEGANISMDPDPVFDAAMVRRIKRFQLSQDLEPDGTIGPKTLMRLAAVGDSAAPQLSAPGDR